MSSTMLPSKPDGVTITQFTTSDSKRGAQWAQAVNMGFNQPQLSEKAIEAQLKIFGSDDLVVTAAYLDSPEGVGGAGALPVGTFGAFRESVNLGAARVPVSMFTAATVRNAYKRRGILRAMIELNLRQAADEGVPLALLTASDASIYGRFGFQSVVSEASVEIKVDKFKLTKEAQAVIDGYYVDWALRDDLFKAVREVALKAHQTTRGSTSRHFTFDLEMFMSMESGEYESKYRGVLAHDPAGEVVGYAVYEFVTEGWKTKVRDLDATDPRAEIALWNHLARIEGQTEVSYADMSVSNPLRLALVNERAVKVTGVSDFLWARILDPVTCLEARSYSFSARSAALSAAFTVEDPMGYCSGTFQIQLGDEGASVRKLDPQDPVAVATSTTISVNALDELVFASASVSDLVTVGMIRGLPAEDVEKWDAMFAPATPARFNNFF
ncbi:GNAT family N-acetyltransferase [Schaalia sp. JY-X159]|uniref:GNAT family N-acetyltransferase n=1 Tax=Schaalia sp. JY-X159 TaxID=2758575 RepID=UPI00165DE139|nr:GNAT family N-acetyltransferase [Schaalia sp. JY-X159]